MSYILNDHEDNVALAYSSEGGDTTIADDFIDGEEDVDFFLTMGDDDYGYDDDYSELGDEWLEDSYFEEAEAKISRHSRDDFWL